jgi:hypothetical protein
MRFIKKIYSKLILFLSSLFFGMKGAESVLTSNRKHESDSSIEVTDDEVGGVFKDILEERITQEVEELRYTSYKVANESKKYRYIGNGKVVKKTETQLTEKHGSIDESDNLPIILIQDNNIICEDVLTILNEINNKENKKIFSDYTLKIKRSIFPRFLIEKYIKKIVLKQSDGNYVIDLYCSIYPSQFSERKDKAFISELKRIKNGEVRNSDVFDIDEISFITTNAWGVDDWLKFSFVDFEFYNIIEFDGSYIIRLGCQSNVFMENLLDKIYSESAEKKYETKELKNNTIVDFTSFIKNDDYTIQEGINLDLLDNVNFSIEIDDK